VTSSLDAINEKAVQQVMDEMLGKFNGVTIVVAHRLTTICNCDKIIVMGDDGTKVEEGTRHELLQVPKQEDANGKPIAGPGLYHTLWDTQQVESTGSENDTTELKEILKKKNTEMFMQKKEIVTLKKGGLLPYSGGFDRQESLSW